MLLTARAATSLACRSSSSSGPLILRQYRNFNTQSEKNNAHESLARESLSTSISKQHSLPLFRIPSSDVQLIEQPSEFYAELLAIISRAKRRVFLASLYVGKTETKLMHHLREALANRKGLEVTILVDNLRSTREGEYRGTPESSSCASLLASLQRDYPDRVQIRLYRTPGLPTWLEKLVGKRFVEGWGLQHMKIYGGDDEVMISGANLSNDYFTDRRDRYIYLQDEQFSQYMYHLLMIAARYSYRLSAIGSSNQKLDGKHDDNHAAFTLSWDEGRNLPMTIDGTQRGAKNWKVSMHKEVESLTNQYHNRDTPLSTEKSEGKKKETIDVVPLLQMGPIGIRQETTCVPFVLLAADSPQTRLDFTTGYFSINPNYAKYIIRQRFQSEMVTASPQANGFHGSKGISGYLPAAYTWLEHQFWEKLMAYKRGDTVTIREWSKKGWTYHAKGIWLYPERSIFPTVTLLGSSNFGSRSAMLDLECTLLIDASQSKDIQRRLKEEVDELKKDANDIVGEEMFARQERKVPLGVKIATWVIKGML